jgi:hypothetical protein
MEKQELQVKAENETKPTYEPPRVTVMDEAEVLKTFQFTSAGVTWWVM